MKRYSWIVLVLLFSMILGACAPAAPASPTQGSQSTPTAPAGPEALVSLSALQALAEKLGIEVGQIKVVSVEEAEWTDSCLGLGGPAESCLQAMTPGYRVMLEAGGQTYEVRVSKDGTAARVADPNQLESPVDVSANAAAVARAVAALAQQLGIDPATIQLVRTEAVDFSDSCLGLGGPDELCAQAITPGFSIILQAGGKEYEVRANEAATFARVNLQGLGSLPQGPLSEPMAKAIEVLAEQLGVGPREVSLIHATATQWPDGCLGLGRADEGCIAALVDGYQFIFQVNEQQYEVRTDAKGGTARVSPDVLGGDEPTSGNVDDLTLITWKREGGIAGSCDQITVYAAGTVEAASCKGNRPAAVGSFTLSEAQMSQLEEWVRGYGSFEYLQEDPATADAMSTTLVFTGSGTLSPSQEQQDEVAAFVAGLFAEASGK